MFADFDVTHAFVGREQECRLLDELVRRAHSRGGVAVVCGQAGVGKTALLHRVAEVATARALWARGVESELVLPFAGILDLLLPLRSWFDHLPDVQREALEVSLALRSGTICSPLAVCVATLGVLSAAAGDQPLLVLVDDFQWIDVASQQVLLFVARRLSTERVVMVLGFREQPDRWYPLADLPTVRLEGLTIRECRELAVSLQTTVVPTVLIQLVERTGGNPLALIEAIRSLPSEYLEGRGAKLPERLLGPTLVRVWWEVVDELPEPTRVALFVVAASRSNNPADLEPVLVDLGMTLVDLDPAERVRLLRTSPETIVLRHPLLRSVILENTSLATRLRVYQALAAHADGTLRAWYLAASVVGPDETVANGLAEVAEATRERCDYASSARTWKRAAELTNLKSIRAKRWLAAAEDALLAGDSFLAKDCCENALECSSDLRFAADVEIVRSHASTWLGYPIRAVRELIRVGNAIAELDPKRAARLYAEAAMPCVMAGRIRDMIEVVQQSEAVYPVNETSSLQTVAMMAQAHTLAGKTVDSRRLLDLGQQLVDRADPVRDLHYVAMLGRSRVWLEDFAGARVALDDTLPRARIVGARSILATVLTGRCELDWWTGHWTSAYADGVEASGWAEETGNPASICYALWVVARLDAARGNLKLCRQRIREAEQYADSFEIGFALLSVLGLASLGDGDLDAAINYLDQATDVTKEIGLTATNVVPLGGDLVDALVHTGQVSRAQKELTWLDRRAHETGLVYPAAAAARGHGMLADNLDSAEQHFARAKALYRKCRMPFEQARSLLCEAETLRRLRRPTQARPLLRQAMVIFNRLGAAPWATRASVELAATGARPTAEPPLEQRALDVLTPQEFQIARLVAEGLNNSEVAAALFLSRKTVEAHLTRVYRKLGVRSRTGLARLLAMSDF